MKSMEGMNNSEDNQSKKKQILTLNIELPSNNELDDKVIDKKAKIIFYIKIVIVIIYFALIISIEQLYRENLFNKSIDVQEDIREDHVKEGAFYNFWEFMSLFGLAKITFPIFGIIFVFFPTNTSFSTLQVLIYSIYITNLFKIIYRNGRPYWQSDILDIVCNSGYGNPSGHSVTSAAYYLTLPHIVTNFDFFKSGKKGIILRIIIFCLFYILGILVMISRVILAAHSINQVIYGFTLGLGIYFIMIHILSYHTCPPNDFMKHITSNLVIIIYMSFHIALIVLLIIIYFTLDDNQIIKNNAMEKVFNGVRCTIKKDYLMFKHDGFFQALSLTSIIGAHLGIILLVSLLKKLNYVINEYIAEFNKSSVKRWLIRLPILLISGIFIILNFTVSGSNALSIVFLFKSAISFFLTTLGLYFIGVFICIHFNLSNENIERIK